MSNLINNKSELRKFSDDKLKFIVSSRRITPDVSIIDHLKIQYIYLDLSQIKSVFGSVNTHSRLYGGRIYEEYHSLTDDHVKELYKHNIGISLNLTNHFFDKESYESSQELLNRYHSKNNSLIITNDELAKNIRKDFPDYILKASIVKNITNIKRIEKAYEYYDYVTLPMDMNDDDEFLMSIPEKERIIMFANANCAYTCPARTCYYGFSQHNRGEEVTSECSLETIPRLDHGPVYFNVAKLKDMGFDYFKLVPLFYDVADDANRYYSWKKKDESAGKNYRVPDAFVVSYPKSGRTWLRFILANYFNEFYKLNMNVDLHNVFKIVPNEYNHKEIGIEAFDFYENKDVPFIPFSHSKNYRKIYKEKVIVLIRSPFDILVSDYFQQTEQIKSYKGGIKEFIRDDEKGIKNYCEFMNNWIDHIIEKEYFALSYEEMQENIFNVIGELLNYLDIEVNEDILNNSIELSNFNRMQDIEKSQGIISETYDFNNPLALRMREGGSGNHKKYLNNDDIAYIYESIKKGLKKEVIDLLEVHNCISIESMHVI